MTEKGYKAYAEELKRHGYQHREDSPYDGRNEWVKYLVQSPENKAYIRIPVFRREDDNGFVEYRVRPSVQIFSTGSTFDSITAYLHTWDLLEIEGFAYKLMAAAGYTFPPSE